MVHSYVFALVHVLKGVWERWTNIKGREKDKEDNWRNVGSGVKDRRCVSGSLRSFKLKSESNVKKKVTGRVWMSQHLISGNKHVLGPSVK